MALTPPRVARRRHDPEALWPDARTSKATRDASASIVYLTCIVAFIIVAMLVSFLNKFTNDFGLGKNGDFEIHLMQFPGAARGHRLTGRDLPEHRRLARQRALDLGQDVEHAARPRLRLLLLVPVPLAPAQPEPELLRPSSRVALWLTKPPRWSLASTFRSLGLTRASSCLSAGQLLARRRVVAAPCRLEHAGLERDFT